MNEERESTPNKWLTFTVPRDKAQRRFFFPSRTVRSLSHFAPPLLLFRRRPSPWGFSWLTKFAAPRPFLDPKVKVASVRTVLFTANPAHSTTPKQPAPAASQKPHPVPAPASHTKPLDISKYDGGFEIENEKRGKAVDGEAAQEPALDSSVSRCVFFPDYTPDMVSQDIPADPYRQAEDSLHF